MKTNYENRHLFKRGRNNGDGIGFAIFLILFGGIFLLFNLNIIPIEYKSLLISWQMLLIAIGVWTILKRQYVGGIILVAIGAFFIYPILSHTFPEYFISINIDFHTYWPILLIIFGTLLVLSKLFPSHKNKWRQKCTYDSRNWNNNTIEQDSADYIDKNMVFGSSEQIVLSQNLKGGEANTVFGELIIDLRKAKLTEGIVNLELNTVFGSIILYVPSDWIVEINSSTVLGSFQDKRNQVILPASDIKSRLIIEGNSVFGSGEIRN